jgi:hypothetical protein
MDASRRLRSGWPLGVAVLLLAAALAAAAWFVAARMEGQRPSVTIDGPSPYPIGKSTELALELADAASGLRSVRAALSKDGREVALAAVEFPPAGILGLKGPPRETLRIPVDPAALGVSDGPAQLKLAVRDRSWRNWGRGNLTEVAKEVLVDTRPPVITLFTQQNYLNLGGSGVAVYRLSEASPHHGVRVGASFYPGFSGVYADRSVQVAFFALAHDLTPDAPILLEATDAAGNAAQIRFPHHLRRRTFQKDQLTISDGFIRQVLPGLQHLLPPDVSASLKDAFLYINREQRRVDEEAIVALTRTSQPEMLWQGAFGRLPNSAPRAGFADRRTYLYQGVEIDRQDHMGADLASTANAPVPAANAGVVAAAEFIGIYGQTVILDHGLGLFSMYSHLSQITVAPGDRLNKGDVLGTTGATGLAGGDHLHFGIMVHPTFVDPVEWWDPKWIRDNITLKLDAAPSPRARE